MKGGADLSSEHQYQVAGLTLWSHIDLPPLCTCVEERLCPELRVTMREELRQPLGYGFAGSVQRFEISIPNVARYCVENGRKISITPASGVSAETLRQFLLGSGFGALWHQRGLLPLHASVVGSGAGNCVAFTGDSGAGKSTLAALFASRGRPVLSDDVCPVSLDGCGAEVRPAVTRLKLRPDALAHLGDFVGSSPMEEGDISECGGDRGRPVCLRAVYLLRDAEAGESVRIDEQTGLAALKLLMDNVYRRSFAEEMGLLTQVFHLCARLLSTVRVYTLTRPRNFDCEAELISFLEHHWSR